ncbi:MAG: signal peptidase II [Bacteriovoracaceae bacterium]
MNRIYRCLVMIFFMIIADQVTKGYFQQNFQLGESVAVIDGFFNFTYVQNKGAAFGMGAGANDTLRMVIFKIIPVFVCFYLFYLMFIYRNREEKKIMVWGYALVLAGAVGNLIDRISLDYVVDFLDFYYKSHHYPAFNIADSCITVAIGILIVETYREEKREKLEKEKQALASSSDKA